MTITQEPSAPCASTTAPTVLILPASTYVRRTVDRLTTETRKPGQDPSVWDYVHLLGIVAWLAAAGHEDTIREAADKHAQSYALPTQAEVEQEAGR